MKLNANKIFGNRKDKIKLPADHFVDDEHYLHNLIKGVYKSKKSKFIQSLVINPRSKWGLEIDRNHPTFLLNYDFQDYKKYKKDIIAMQECFKLGLPIGLLFRLNKGLYKCLGLGKIISIDGTKCVIDSFGITNEKSKQLKKETLSEFDALDEETTVINLPDVSFETISNNDLKERFPLNDSTNAPNVDSHCLSISAIIQKVESGELVIPDFQRFYVWSKEMIQSFFDSIFNRYYISPFLFWEPNNQEKIGISPVKGVEIKDPHGNQIIIDGQQRISSIYYALKSPNFSLKKRDVKTYFYIDFGEFVNNYPNHEDVIKIFNKKIILEDQYTKLLFPLNQLMEYDAWSRDLERYLESNYKKLDRHEIIMPIVDIIRARLRFILQEFSCPYIILRDTKLNTVVEIFSRINTMGQKLNAFDLLIAKLSSNDIQLRSLWEKGCKKYSRIEEYLEKTKNSTQGLSVLHAMSMCFTESKSCKRSDILTIFSRMNSDKKDFELRWKEMLEYIDRAIEMLEDRIEGFGVISPDNLPSESIIPVLAALLRTMDNKFKDSEKDCHEKIRCWYWTSVLTNVYSGSSDSQKTLDYKQIGKWFKDSMSVPKSIDDFRKNFFDSSKFNLSDITKRGSSSFNAILDLYVIKGSKDWAFDKIVSRQNMPRIENKANIDHIFPKSKYKNEIYIESILNKTWQRKSTNQYNKRAKDPSVFLEEILEKILRKMKKNYYII